MAKEATVRKDIEQDWFKTGKGVWQGCTLLFCLFNFYAEYNMQNAGLYESQAGIKIARRKNNNLRYADGGGIFVAKSCPTLGTLWTDCSLSGSSVHGILQARILEWVAIFSLRGSSWLRDWTGVSCMSGRLFTNWAMREDPLKKYFQMEMPGIELGASWMLSVHSTTELRPWCDMQMIPL